MIAESVESRECVDSAWAVDHSDGLAICIFSLAASPLVPQTAARGQLCKYSQMATNSFRTFVSSGNVFKIWFWRARFTQVPRLRRP